MSRFYLLFSFGDWACWVRVSEKTFNLTIDYFQKHLHNNALIDVFDDSVFEYTLGGDAIGYVVRGVDSDE